MLSMAFRRQVEELAVTRHKEFPPRLRLRVAGWERLALSQASLIDPHSESRIEMNRVEPRSHLDHFHENLTKSSRPAS